jgi:hypothetical protein
MVTEASLENSAESHPIIIDIGKHKKKKIKQLRNGKGDLFEQIGHYVQELKNAKQVNEDAQILVVVVKEKNRKNWKFLS